MKVKMKRNVASFLTALAMLLVGCGETPSESYGGSSGSDDGTVSSTPITPEEPATPGTPEEPEEPETPETPETPENPYAELVDFVVEVEAGREIRVLQLSDPQIVDYSQRRKDNASFAQCATEMTELYCYRYIRQIVNGYDPDLILVTGDIIYGAFDDNGSVLTGFVEFMEEFDIPWAPVFGNHDQESAMGADWQCKQFEEAENCLFKQRELSGNGNYSVGLVQGGELKRVFFMLDSNGCGNASQASLSNGHTMTWTGFGDDQIEWYTLAAEKIKEASPETKLSFAFHIQLSAFQYAFDEYVEYSTYEKYIRYDLDKDENAKANGDFGYIGRVMKSPWDSDKRVWNGLKALGVDSIFVGHEHCNSFSVEYEGVRLTYGQKSSQYDRYNKIKNGEVVTYETGAPTDGEPLVGGTRIEFSETDGSICDAGLLLYDKSLDTTEYERQGVTENEDGSVTLAPTLSGTLVYTSQLSFEVMGYSSSYLGIKGQYGTNTYVDITFKGNNMPNVLFFADKINGDMTSYGGKGLLLAGGIVGSSGIERGQNRLAVYGPNRIPAAFDVDAGLDTQTYGYSNGKYGYVYNSDDARMTAGASFTYEKYPLLTTQGLREDTSDRTYRYTVGTYVNGSGYVVVDIQLYDEATNALIYDTQSVTTLTAADAVGGSIVLYAAGKGADEATTFRYSRPYYKETDPIKLNGSNVTKNSDGSYTLKGGSVINPGWFSGCHKALSDLGYFGFAGDYGVGTYVDITFKGNNMPMVTFFANTLNGEFTRGGASSSDAPANTGITVMNGLYTTSYTPNVQFDYLSIWGANRYCGLGNGKTGETGGKATLDESFAYGQTALAASPDTTYQYTVGTYADGEYVGVEVILKNADTGAVLYSGKIKTHVKLTEVTADNILIQAGVTGADTTILSYSAPYTKKS